jgi:molecular chaperone IbpA
MRNNSRFFSFGTPFDGDNFFNDVFGQNAWRDFNRIFSTLGASAQPFPPHNIYALKDGSARIDFALAGYDQDGITLKAEDGKLIIEGKGKDEEGCDCGPSRDCGDDCECVYHGIRSANFRKSIEMPTKFDLSQCKATMKNGMLSVTIPLAEERKAKDIKVDIATE